MEFKNKNRVYCFDSSYCNQKNNKGAFKSPLKVAPYPRLGAPCCGTQDKHIQNIHVRPIYHKII